MRSLVRVSLGIVGLLMGPERLAAQAAQSAPRGVMDGIVTDTALVPIAGATILLTGSTVTATTGENGRFRIVALPPGEYVVMARRLGYGVASVTVRLAGGDTVRPAFSLQRVTPELDTVRASATYPMTRFGEFEERRAHSIGGHFITEEDIEKRNPVMVSDMFRGVLSVKVDTRGYKVMSNRAVAPCAFQIFVDGILFDESGDLYYAPSVKEIAAMEVYSGPATVPLQYKRPDTQCGVILIWTKGGK